MTGDEILDQVMTEVAGLREPESVIREADAPVWLVMIDDDAVLEAAHDAQRDMVVLSMALGRPSAGLEAQVNDLLLRYSFVWRHNWGVHAALDGEGEAHLLFVLPTDILDAPMMERAIGALMAMRPTWRTILEGVAPAEGGAEAAPSGIRV